MKNKGYTHDGRSKWFFRIIAAIVGFVMGLFTPMTTMLIVRSTSLNFAPILNNTMFIVGISFATAILAALTFLMIVWAISAVHYYVGFYKFMIRDYAIARGHIEDISKEEAKKRYEEAKVQIAKAKKESASAFRSARIAKKQAKANNKFA